MGRRYCIFVNKLGVLKFPLLFLLKNKSSQLFLRNELGWFIHLFYKYLVYSYKALLSVHLNQIKVQEDYCIGELSEHLLRDNHYSKCWQLTKTNTPASRPLDSNVWVSGYVWGGGNEWWEVLLLDLLSQLNKKCGSTLA